MTPSPAVAQRLLLVFLVLLGFLARAATTKSPLLDHHGWRQADTAAIARSFYLEDFNIARPQVDWRGISPTGYVATGLELHAWLVAALAFLIGFRVSHGRLLSCVWFIASATMLYRFLRDRYSGVTAIVGTGAYAFGFPLLVYMDRTFMNEPLLLMLTFLAYRAAQRHLATGVWTSYGLLAIATTLLGMIKAPYLMAWGGVLGLFIERHGAKTLRLWRLYVLVALSLFATLIWYSHAQALGARTGLTFGLSDKIYDPEVVFSLRFWAVMVERLAKDIFGPIGLVALVWGAIETVKVRRWFEPAALSSAVVYLVLVARGNLVHDYYQLALVPVGAVLVAAGLTACASRLGRGSQDREVTILTAAVLLMVATTFVRSYNSWYGYAWEKTHICAEGPRQTTPADRLIVIGDGNPELMFCLDRKGWITSPDSLSPARLDELRASGASLVLVSSRLRNEALLDWLAARAQPLVRNPRYTLLRIQ
jgi:hypothetical protein